MKRSPKHLKAMVDRYKLVMRMQESYQCSVFYVPYGERNKGYETELQYLATTFKADSGLSIDSYTWKV